jgi:hypothetical protein
MTKNSRLKPGVWQIAVLALAAGIAVPWGEVARAAGQVTAVEFSITPAVDGTDTVLNDGRSDGAYQYTDYRLAEESTCVDAQELSRALVFIVLNRKLDAAGTRCDNDPQPAGSASPGLSRQWVVEVGNAGACTRLANYDPDYVSLNPDGTCTLNGADNPRIRLANAFASRVPAKTPVAFLVSSFQPPSGHGGYEIRSVIDATVVGDATTRYISLDDGQAQLVEFIGKAKAVELPFPMRLHMTLTRTQL